ncbi:MAG TPA: hypothetical protein VIM11_05135 [Tepidisphaeraceae bacterium]
MTCRHRANTSTGGAWYSDNNISNSFYPGKSRKPKIRRRIPCDGFRRREVVVPQYGVVGHVTATFVDGKITDIFQDRG